MEKKEDVWAKYLQAKKYKTDNNFMSDLEEAYRYCCPRRYNRQDNNTETYDSTAVYAVQARTASNHDSLFPVFREWIQEVPVSQYMEADRLMIERQLDKRKANAHKAIELSNFHTEIEDTLTDALFGDGAILVFAGTPEKPLVFEAVDWCCFYTMNDMNNEPRNNFLERKLKAAEIHYKWPKAEFDNDAGDLGKKVYNVMDCYTYSERDQIYTYSVFMGEKLIYQVESATSPWVVFSQKRRLVGKNGWGQVMDTMPDVKTTNKIEEYLLRNAAVAVSGMWTAEDDGVLNPSTVQLRPGVVIPKAPGSKGLEPLKTGVDMNLSQFVLNDLKTNIKKAVQGSALPDYNSGVRTASEYQLRDAEMKKTEIPQMLQLAQASKRLAERIFEVLESNKMKTSAFYCPKAKDSQNRIIETAFTSPLIRMRDQIEMKSSLQVMATAAQIFGQNAYDVIKADKFLYDFYLKNGFTADCLREEKEIDEYRQQKQQNDIALAQAGVQQTSPNPGNVSL